MRPATEEALHLALEVGRCRVTIPGRHGHGFSHDPQKLPRDADPVERFLERGIRPDLRPLEQERAGAPVIRRGPGHDFVEHRAQAEHVGALVAVADLPPRRLRGHVGHRTDGRARLAAPTLPRDGLDAVAQHEGKPPIDDIHRPVLADHDVVGLEIAVNHPPAVRERHRVADLEEYLQPLAKPLRAPGRALRLAQPGIEAHAAHRLHREIRRSVRVDPEVVHRHDVRVVHLRRDLRFFDEPLDRGFLLGKLRRQKLHRDLAQQRRVANEANAAHPPAVDLADVHVARLHNDGSGADSRGASRASWSSHRSVGRALARDAWVTRVESRTRRSSHAMAPASGRLSPSSGASFGRSSSPELLILWPPS